MTRRAQPETAEQALARKYAYLHGLTVEKRNTRGGVEQDQAALDILNHVCGLHEATPNSTLYFHKLVHPNQAIGKRFIEAGVFVGWHIDNLSYVFTLAVEGYLPTYSIRIIYPHPAAIFQPSCETVH